MPSLRATRVARFDLIFSLAVCLGGQEQCTHQHAARCRRDFLVAMDSDSDGEVTVGEFLAYYAQLSAAYATDAEFTDAILLAWNLDRKVRQSHATPGTQTKQTTLVVSYELVS